MSDVLVIEVDADAQSVARAAIVGEETRWLSDVSEAAIASEGVEEAVFVLNGTCVATHQLQVPDFPDSKLLKILPGLVDDKIAVFGGNKHFAPVGERDGETGERTIAVVSSQVMEQLQALSKVCGVSLRAVLPDFLLLEQPDEGITAYAVDDRVVAITPSRTGFAAEPEQASLMLGMKVEPRQLSEAEWQNVLISSVHSSVNLLQGAYAPSGNLIESLRWLKRSAILAAATVMVWAGGLLVDASANYDQSEALYAVAEKIFREAQPNVSRIVNMEAQMRRAVNEARQQGGGEFFVLSDIIFSAVQQQSQTMLETMRYDAEDSAVALTVSFSSFSESEEFKRALQQAGARVAEGSSRQESSRVFSELTVGRAE